MGASQTKAASPPNAQPPTHSPDSANVPLSSSSSSQLKSSNTTPSQINTTRTAIATPPPPAPLLPASQTSTTTASAYSPSFFGHNHPTNPALIAQFTFGLVSFVAIAESIARFSKEGKKAAATSFPPHKRLLGYGATAAAAWVLSKRCLPAPPPLPALDLWLEEREQKNAIERQQRQAKLDQLRKEKREQQQQGK